MSISPSRDGLDHRQPVVLVAQGRLDLEEGAVIADVERVERQVMDRDARRHVQPRRFGTPQRRQGGGGGDLVGVVAHARQLDQSQIPLQPHPLGHGRDAGQPAERGELAGGDGGAVA